MKPCHPFLTIVNVAADALDVYDAVCYIVYDALRYEIIFTRCHKCSGYTNGEITMATAVKEQIIEVENTVEEKTNNALTQVTEVGRKSLFATLGIGRMIYDGALNGVDRSKRFLDEAVERGEGVEQKAMDNAKEISSQVEERASSVQERLSNTYRRSERGLENGLDSQIEAVLNRLDLPSRSSIAKLNADLQALNEKVNGLVAAQVEVVVELPLAGYDKLTAKEIVSKLNGLTIDELAAVKQYEMAHENRVTVLRAVDSKVEGLKTAVA